MKWHNLLELPNNLFSTLRNQQHDVTASIPLIFTTRQVVLLGMAPGRGSAH